MLITLIINLTSTFNSPSFMARIPIWKTFIHYSIILAQPSLFKIHFYNFTNLKFYLKTKLNNLVMVLWHKIILIDIII